jgi:hypothetical protein
MTWEYHVCQPTPRWNRSPTDELQAVFDRLGADGWELVCATGAASDIFVFKRAKAKAKPSRAATGSPA